MGYVTGVYDEQGLTVYFDGVDYGWEDGGRVVERIEIKGVNIWGVEVDFKTLPAKLQEKIMELQSEVDFE